MKGKLLPWVLGLAVVLPLFLVLGFYWYKFSTGLFGPLSSEPEDWSHFGSYVGGLLAPIYAAIAAVGAFMMIGESRGQNRFDRGVTMLRQSLQARPSDFGKSEPTEQDARNNLVLAFSENVVDGEGWEGVLESFAARQYDFLELPFDKIVRRLEEALAIIAQENNFERQQHLLDWLYLELRDHEYYLLAAYVISDPKSRLANACRKMGLLKGHRFRSVDITTRLIDIGFEPTND